MMNDKYIFTPQKAIDKLKQLLPDESQITIGGRRNGKELELAIRMGIKALEKQIPKKVVKRDAGNVDIHEEYYCPNCDRIVVSDCCRCGQLLDWGND